MNFLYTNIKQRTSTLNFLFWANLYENENQCNGGAVSGETELLHEELEKIFCICEKEYTKLSKFYNAFTPWLPEIQQYRDLIITGSGTVS